MKISDKGLELIKSFEGCHLTAYICPAGKLTIGYGHTGSVTPGMTITKVQAENFLKEDCARFEAHVSSFDKKYAWTQNEFDALVSFAFNIGSINQLTANGTRSKDIIAKKILEYNKSGGRVLNGLTKRRQAEHGMFVNSDKGADKVMRTLKLGMEGQDVKELQEALTLREYPLGAIDGDFGNKTKNALIAFQKDAGLVQDGICGPKTRVILEQIQVFSFKNDKNKQISKNFKVSEFKCNDGTDKIVVDTEFVETILQKIREHFKAAVTINSAYRTPSYNKKVGGSSNSYHVKGRAFDIVVKGYKPNEVAKYARSIGVKGVIEYNTFVHVDSRPTKYWARNDNGKVTLVK